MGPEQFFKRDPRHNLMEDFTSPGFLVSKLYPINPMQKYSNGIKITGNEKHNQSHESRSGVTSGVSCWPREVAGGLWGSWVPSWCCRRPQGLHVASGGFRWPWEVAGYLKGCGWPEFVGDLEGHGWPHGVMGGLRGSQVASRGCWWEMAKMLKTQC
jgi:hypothetical protein